MLNYEFPPIGGGGAPVSFELCRELVRRGHVVDVVTMHARGTKRFEVVDGINIFRVLSLRRKNEICYPYEMATYVASAIPFCLQRMRKHKYDLIHAHFIFPTGVVGAVLKWRTKVPLVVTAHGSDIPLYNPDRFRFLHRLLHPMWRKVVRSIDTLIAPSEYLKHHIQTFANIPVTVIPNGFRMELIAPSIRERKILIVSRIFRRKGVQYFLEAIKDMDLDWEIIVAGDGPYLPQLKKQAENIKPRVNFTGFVQNDQLHYLYETSSIFIFTSQNESFGVVLLEAMSAGLAIITTNVSALPEVVENTALLVEPNNPQQIREAVLKLINNKTLREELGNKGRERAKLFNWPTITARYEAAYRVTPGVTDGSSSNI
ncbi:MAG: glycosyltransferase family 4 protein [Candidatus Andersenbacteria bacterium]|nr:glycosyltransferase family 4 protein [Candidatus Andersenbacteria bacterium]